MLPNPARKKSNKPRTRNAPPFERRLLISILFVGVPGALLSILLLWMNTYTLDHKVEGTVLVLLLCGGMTISARNKIVNALRVLLSVVAALKEDNFSFRAKTEFPGGILGDLATEINDLSRLLEQQRLGSIDSVTLLDQVMTEVGSVIMAFSPDGRVHLINRAAAAFLGAAEPEIVGRSAEELGIDDLLNGPASESIFRTGAKTEEKRWIVRRKQFRRHGIVHQLVVLSEASEALRAEERVAWQRLIRVLSHEINNSLAPIKSIARTLQRTSLGATPPGKSKETLEHGLEVISSRAESLNRFVQNYARVSQLPSPTPYKTSLDELVGRIAQLESRLSVEVIGGPNCDVEWDADQIQQAFINLVRNAADAVLHRHAAPDSGAVTISWSLMPAEVQLWIRDTGLGLAETENLFVPFYTTKENGAGIGLLLSRQIIEAHHGTLALRNRDDQPGCEVEVRLPRCVSLV